MPKIQKGPKVNIAKLAGIDEFLPHYQDEEPLKFDVLLKRYLDNYYDPMSRHSGKGGSYHGALTEGIKHTNKKMMLDKLGLDPGDDVESINPKQFRRLFLELAGKHNELNVDGEDVSYAGQDSHRVNPIYEELWQQVHEQMKGKKKE